MLVLQPSSTRGWFGDSSSRRDLVFDADVVVSSRQVTVNPKQQVPESSFDNNVARCDVYYTGSSARVSGCTTTS